MDCEFFSVQWLSTRKLIPDFNDAYIIIMGGVLNILTVKNFNSEDFVLPM